MSVAQLLNHLQTGDVIIVRGATAWRPRPMAGPEIVELDGISAHDLLRNLIAVRKDGGKK